MGRSSSADPPDDGTSSDGVSVVPVTICGVRGLVIDLPLARTELPECLTDAERDVVELLLEGRTNQEIADLRGRSYRTIANQLAAIYRKLGVASRTELIASLDSQ